MSYYVIVPLIDRRNRYTLKTVNLDSREGLAKFRKIFFEDVILNIELTWSQFDHQWQGASGGGPFRRCHRCSFRKRLQKTS